MKIKNDFKKKLPVPKFIKPTPPRLMIRFINRFNRADYDDGMSAGKLVAVADYVH